MNIFYCTTFLHFGAGRVLVELAKFAKQNGHQPVIAATAKIDQYFSQNHLIEEAEQAGIPVFLCEDLFTRNFGQLDRSAGQLAEIFADEKFDIIHSHAAIPGFVAAVAAKRAYSTCLPHISSVHAWGPQKKDWMKLQDVLFLNSVDKVHSVSADVKEFLVGEGVNPAKIEVIYNGCDFQRIDEMTQAEVGSPKDDKIIIGTVAELSERKGIKRLLAAVAALPAETKEKLHAIIVGDGPQRKELALFAKEQGLGDTVTFTGFAANPFEHMHAFDLFILPSTSEGLPVALVEAMYLRIPVIATNVQGNREIAGDGRGLLVPLDDIPALAQQITAFCDNPQSFGSRVCKAFEWVTSNFIQKHCFQRILQLYETTSGSNAGAVR